MNLVYCSQCGKKIQVFRKALPQYSRIIDMIQPHFCEELAEIEWDLTPFPIPANAASLKGDKFNDKLDETLPKVKDLGDRRPVEFVKPALGDKIREQLLGTKPKPTTEINDSLVEEEMKDE